MNLALGSAVIAFVGQTFAHHNSTLDHFIRAKAQESHPETLDRQHQAGHEYWFMLPSILSTFPIISWCRLSILTSCCKNDTHQPPKPQWMKYPNDFTSMFQQLSHVQINTDCQQWRTLSTQVHTRHESWLPTHLHVLSNSCLSLPHFLQFPVQL